jgi:RNA polymerase sigma factor (sigma-70 family)
MEEHDPGTPSESLGNPACLLAAYLDSGRQEACFIALVERLGGIVFTSALRRTGNRALTEEITQNVFALLARKAPSLRSHPNLSAWIFRTTQLESAKTMRSEKRHQRKLDAFASEQASAGAADDTTAVWREALPALDASLDQLPEKDRALVIQRFFERKRFAEIASSTGRSEAACKMQVKRALEKLATLLRSRGVALSVPVIATGLSAEFAKAAPLASSALASQALAASAGVSSSTLLTNTLLTMSTAKSSALTAAAVVALSLFPLIHQQSEAAKLRAEIAALEKTTVSEISTRPSRRPATSDSRSARTLRERLHNNRQPVEADTLLGDLMKVTMEQDIVGLIRVLTPIAAMTPAEYAKLMEDIEAHDASPEAKSTALMMLASFAPETDFRQRIETLLRQGAAPGLLGDPLRRWASTDPDAALAWFESTRVDGQLLGKGINSDPAPGLYAEILVGIAATRPARALELAASMPEHERAKYRLDTRLAVALVQESIQSGDTRHLDQFIADTTDPGAKSTLVRDATDAIGESAGLEAVHTFLVRTYPTESGEVVDARMLTLLTDADRIPFTDRAEWIVQNADEKVAGEKLHYIITNEIELGEDVAKWIGTQAPGAVRDQAQAAYAEITALRSGHLAGLREAEAIADPELKLATRRGIAKTWLRLSPDDARKNLPADLLPQQDN